MKSLLLEGHLVRAPAGGYYSPPSGVILTAVRDGDGNEVDIFLDRDRINKVLIPAAVDDSGKYAYFYEDGPEEVQLTFSYGITTRIVVHENYSPVPRAEDILIAMSLLDDSKFTAFIQKIAPLVGDIVLAPVLDDYDQTQIAPAA